MEEILPDDLYEKFAGYIEQHFGIVLGREKKVLLSSRLKQTEDLVSGRRFEDVYRELLTDATSESASRLAEKVSTNYSYFFREPSHFDAVCKKLLFEREKPVASGEEIRIWSAGCATGEEPYTMAIFFLEALKQLSARPNFRILATDLSLKALLKAEEGVYPSAKLKDVPPALLKKYFSEAGDAFRLGTEPREHIVFKKLNLKSFPFGFQKKFHAVFCRNVLIYFSPEFRAELVRAYHQVLEPGGLLFIGHAEALENHREHFKHLGSSVYQRVGS